MVLGFRVLGVGSEIQMLGCVKGLGLGFGGWRVQGWRRASGDARGHLGAPTPL